MTNVKHEHIQDIGKIDSSVVQMVAADMAAGCFPGTVVHKHCLVVMIVTAVVAIEAADMEAVVMRWAVEVEEELQTG